MELDAKYVIASALRFMDHLPQSKVPQAFEKVSTPQGRQALDLSGPPTLFDSTEVRTVDG